MKKINSAIIAVDQGDLILFSDFEEGGEMWTGSGKRSRTSHVEFSHAFRDVPTVHVSRKLLDMAEGANQRVDITTENITETGFDIVFKTWGDTRIARASAAWMAIGAGTEDDDWVDV